jgi:aldehyde:ferredoxin oxidoreductase
MNGNTGKILDVNLSTGSLSTRELPEAVYRDFLGGSALAAKIFFDRKGWLADPLGPDNPLIVMTGPLAATGLPGASRLEVCGRSPLTGIWGEASMGGHFAPDLKRAGWDGIVVTGASAKPVFLWIHNEKAELREAGELWGLDSYETETRLPELLGEKRAKVMSIGPAGENRVRYAGIVNDRGSLAARCGLGAVMGSKQLKAIAVLHRLKTGATSPVAFADEEGMKALRQEIAERIRSDVTAASLRAYGSNMHMQLGMAISDIPTQNWRQALWEEGMEALSGMTVRKTIQTKVHACAGCPVACKRIVQVSEGPYAMAEGPGPEYEGAASLGTMLKIDNLPAVAKANELCNRMGLDVISLGGTLAWAIEAFENGVLDAAKTGGIEFGWNRPDVLIALIPKIARRQGFGNELAEGVKRAAEKFGGAEYAIQVKGLEAPMHDPRAMWSMALSYATNPRGACHTKDVNLETEIGAFDVAQIGVKPTPAHSAEGKAAQTIATQQVGQLLGSSVMCVYVILCFQRVEDLRRMVNLAAGFNYSMDEFLRGADRSWYLKRALGNLMGMGRRDDYLPARILTPHLEGHATQLTPLLAGMNRATLKLLNTPLGRNQRLREWLARYTEQSALPSMFKNIMLMGKFSPRARAAGRRIRRQDVEELRRRTVNFDYLLEDYYRLRELDSNGVPQPERLRSLGLSEVSEALVSLRGTGIPEGGQAFLPVNIKR